MFLVSLTHTSRAKCCCQVVAKGVLSAVCDVQEPVCVALLFVERRHHRGCGRQDVVDEDEDSLFGRELDALAYDVHELSHGEVGRHKVLLLVNVRDVTSRCLFDDDWNAVRIFVAYAFRLRLAFVERVFELELRLELARHYRETWYKIERRTTKLSERQGYLETKTQNECVSNTANTTQISCTPKLHQSYTSQISKERQRMAEPRAE
mmetsp:Transcript_430/g.914  ORF Transcript_430/g.914 Transcript_430/m.914 type:complete len:207 (-) Transcript_430:202-822(-)